MHLHSVKDVNFSKHLLHLFPKKLEYTFCLGHPVSTKIFRFSNGMKVNRFNSMFIAK